MENKNPVLKIDNLFKSYGKKEVIKGLSLEIKEGEILGLIGKNGIGKSTTIDCVIGSKAFNSGEITIDGISIKNKPIECKKRYGYISSEPIIYEEMTGYEYLAFSGSLYGLKDKEFEELVKKLSQEFQLTDIDLSYRVKGYSHGMKQKLALMTSLLHDPKIWILDEPTVGLDIIVYHSLMNKMTEFVEENKAILITSHNLDFIGKVCNRVVIINNGIIAREINLDENPEKRTELNEELVSVYGGL